MNAVPVRLIGALLCQDAMLAQDGRVVVWGQYNIVRLKPGGLPHKQPVHVHTVWLMLAAGEWRLSARLFAPSGEMISEAAGFARSADGALRVHTEIFALGQVEFCEPGRHTLAIMRDDDTVLEIPLFIVEEPGQDQGVAV